MTSDIYGRHNPITPPVYVRVEWTPELRRLEGEYDKAKRAYHRAHDGFEVGLARVADEAWERFVRAIEAERWRLMSNAAAN